LIQWPLAQHRLKLVPHVSHGELPFGYTVSHFFLLILRYRLFHCLHEPGYVPETQQSLDKPTGLEGLQVLEVLARADEDHRGLSRSDGTQGSTALRMAVQLRDDDGAHLDRLVEGLSLVEASLTD